MLVCPGMMQTACLPPLFCGFLLFDLQVLERGLKQVLVLEDDVRFEPRFKRRLQAIMDDIDRAQLDWDLM